MLTEAELLKRAKQMRLNPTEPEKRLWRALSNSQLSGYKFRRQYLVPDPAAIIDLFCPSIGLGIEIDGDTHDLAEDVQRDGRLSLLGFRIIRFSNSEVMHNMDGVLETIAATASALPRRWSGARTPPPQPLP